MHVKVGDLQLVSLTLREPLVGSWTAQLQATGAVLLSGQVTITIADAMNFVGTVLPGSAALASGRTKAAVVGGAGGMQTRIAGKCYARVPAALVLSDILSVVGQTVSSTATHAALQNQLRHWIRAANPLQSEVELLLAELGLTSWRILPNGNFWTGVETWPDSQLQENYVIVEDIDENKRATIASNLPNVYPGETFLGMHVDVVEHQLAGPRLRTMVVFQ